MTPEQQYKWKKEVFVMTLVAGILDGPEDSQWFLAKLDRLLERLKSEEQK